MVGMVVCRLPCPHLEGTAHTMVSRLRAAPWCCPATAWHSSCCLSHLLQVSGSFALQSAEVRAAGLTSSAVYLKNLASSQVYEGACVCVCVCVCVCTMFNEAQPKSHLCPCVFRYCCRPSACQSMKDRHPLTVVELVDEIMCCSCAGDDSMSTPAAKTNAATADSGDVIVPNGPDEMWEEASTGTVSSPQVMTTPDFWLPQLSPLSTADPGVKGRSPTAPQAASQTLPLTPLAAAAAPVLAVPMAASSPAAAASSPAAPPARSPLRMEPAAETPASTVAVAHAAADATAGSTSVDGVAAGLSTASAPAAGAGMGSTAEQLFLGAQKRACSVAFQVHLPAQYSLHFNMLKLAAYT